jgi:mono/diheme cytochrome c family protein
MRTPPEGTIPRERTDASPPELTAELLQLGREKFDATCAVCHGLLGDGESVVASKMALRAPPSLAEARIRALSPLALFEIVSQGYGVMPRYGEVLDPRERWAVVAYVRALQISQSLTLADAPDDVRQRMEGMK